MSAKQLTLDLRESPLKAACDYCGTRLVPSDFTTGGGVNAAGETLCFACCGFADVIDMMNTPPGQRGVSCLYVTGKVPRGGDGTPAREDFNPGEAMVVSNWPGSLKMQATAVTRWTRAGFGSERRVVYFRGPVGSWWSGIEYKGLQAGNVLRNVRRLKS